MGNKPSKNTSHLKLEEISRIKTKTLIKDTVKNVEAGNIAMGNKDYGEAFTAYRYAFAILGTCIDCEGLQDSGQLEQLIQFKVTLGYKLHELQCLLSLEDQKRAQEQAQPKVTLSKDKLMLPTHIQLELQNGPNKCRQTKEPSEEAMAYQRLLTNLEVCLPRMQMSDIIGQKEAISLLEDTVVERNMRPDLYKTTDSRGVLLYGPPGNGKTTIAKALAARLAEASQQRSGMLLLRFVMNQVMDDTSMEDKKDERQKPFFKVTAANFKSKWAGQAEITLTAMFKMAQLNGPSVLFIDEVESLFASRSDASGKDNPGDGTVQLFLDLLSNHPKVFFIGATNYPWIIDEAIHRRLIPTYIRMPTRADRIDLLKNLFKGVDHFLLSADFEMIADETESYSFDDLCTLKEEVMQFLRKVTRESEYFKLTQEVDGYTENWTPCMPYEKGATKKNYQEFLKSNSGISFPTVTREVVQYCLDKKHPSVSKETVEKNDLFFEKGKTGVDERMKSKTSKGQKNN